MSNPLAESIAPVAIEVLKQIARDPEAAAILRTLLIGAEAPAPVADADTLITKSELAKKLGKSCSTIDRLDREGAPHSYVGDTKRYSLFDYTAWLSSRGKRGTKARPKLQNEVDVDDVIVGAGLTRGSQ
jgi:hypothetical protein